jgi:hypothetical protein
MRRTEVLRAAMVWSRFVALAKNPGRYPCLRCPFGGHSKKSRARAFKPRLSAMRRNILLRSHGGWSRLVDPRHRTPPDAQSPVAFFSPTGFNPAPDGGGYRIFVQGLQPFGEDSFRILVDRRVCCGQAWRGSHVRMLADRSSGLRGWFIYASERLFARLSSLRQSASA